MAHIEVLDVKLRAAGHGVRYALDRPLAGTTSETHSLDIAGWAISASSPVRCIKVVDEDGRYVRTFAAARPRVAQQNPDIATPRLPGFWIELGLLGLPRITTLEIQAVLEDGHRETLAEISVQRELLRRAGRQRFQPLAVTSVGRTGTTLLMRLLSEHPRIALYRQYPFELRPAKYWLHVLRRVCEMANHTDADYNESFDTLTSFIGHHPFYTGVFQQPQLRGWFAAEYVERLAEFCRQSIDATYERIASVQGTAGATFFCEKYSPDKSPRLLKELYPNAREIVLVRDFRDVLCSINEFNARRGTAEFGRSAVASDEDYIAYLGGQVNLLLKAWQERSSWAHLVRYEDLAMNPLKVLRGITTYLGLASDEAVLQQVVTRGMADSTEFNPAGHGSALADHRTSASLATSVGRWRQQLTAAHAALANAAFGAALREFGYEPRNY